MESVQKAQPSSALRFGRHIVGMALFALANPLIYNSDEPVTRWLSIWAVAIAIALVFFGLYALFFTESAKAAWPKSFFTLAWVFVVLVTVGPYISLVNERMSATKTSNRQAPTTEQIDWDRGTIVRPTSEIDAFLATPPSLEEAKHWTQESTGMSANEPWLKHAPPGSRFCRLHDRVIVVLYPPGARPQADMANIYCANTSVDTPEQLGFTAEDIASKDQFWKHDIPQQFDWVRNRATPSTQPVGQLAQPQVLTPFTGKLDGE
ncbi:MAG: hypothetical protein Q7U48_04735 [Hydrogenophaga sp.]|jgi:hypothetical protein|nr:hypothetical protein [Hydrogenophaga sp.]